MNENLTTNSINIIKCTENKLQQLAQKHTRQKKEEQKCIQIQEWLGCKCILPGSKVYMKYCEHFVTVIFIFGLTFLFHASVLFSVINREKEPNCAEI
jgi:hypothetical protein